MKLDKETIVTANMDRAIMKRGDGVYYTVFVADVITDCGLKCPKCNNNNLTLHSSHYSSEYLIQWPAIYDTNWMIATCSCGHVFELSMAIDEESIKKE